jgi:hypothetical protein
MSKATCSTCGKNVANTMKSVTKTGGRLLSSRAEKEIAAAAQTAFLKFASSTKAGFLKPGLETKDISEEDVEKITSQWLEVVQGSAVKAYINLVKHFSPGIGFKFETLINQLSKNNLDEIKALAAKKDDPDSQALLKKKVYNFVKDHEELASLLRNANVSNFEYMLSVLLKMLLILFYSAIRSMVSLFILETFYQLLFPYNKMVKDHEKLVNKYKVHLGEYNLQSGYQTFNDEKKTKIKKNTELFYDFKSFVTKYGLKNYLKSNEISTNPYKIFLDDFSVLKFFNDKSSLKFEVLNEEFFSLEEKIKKKKEQYEQSLFNKIYIIGIVEMILKILMFYKGVQAYQKDGIFAL